MTHLMPDRLDAFAVGALSDEERAETARHLEECPDCRREVAWIRDLRGMARELPVEAGTSPDQWSEIEARIRTSARRPAGEVVSMSAARQRKGGSSWNRYVLAAAAAVLLVALSSGLTLMLVRSGAPGGEEAPARLTGTDENAGGVTFVSTAEAVEEAYAPTLRDLERALTEDRDRLAPETVETIEESLRVIDQAIRDAQEALRADPGNPTATRTLNGMYETKVQVLRQATGLLRGD